MNGILEVRESNNVPMCGFSEHVATVSELIAMSLGEKEFSLLGINETMLFNIFVNLNFLEDSKLELETILKMDKPPKKGWRLNLDKKTFEYVCEKTGNSKLFRAANKKSVRFIDDDFLKENKFTERNIIDLSKTFIVFSKITLNSSNLVALGISKGIVKIADSRKIHICFNMSTDSYFCNKSKRCPLLKRCDEFFSLAANKDQTSFSCDKCVFYQCERQLERDGAFRERDIYSYGISNYGDFV